MNPFNQAHLSHTSELSSDRCQRCEGLLVPVQMMDIKQIDVLWDEGQRCINCGWISKADIPAHLATPRPSETRQGRGRPRKSPNRNHRRPLALSC